MTHHPIDDTSANLRMRIAILKNYPADRTLSSKIRSDDEFRQQCVIMGERVCRREVARGTDLWLALGGKQQENDDCHFSFVDSNINSFSCCFFHCQAPNDAVGDFHLNTGRFLMFDLSGVDTSEDEHDFLVQRMPKNGVSTERRGGSNGTADEPDPKALRQLLHCPGSSPRRSQGCVFVLVGLTLHVFCVAACEGNFVIRHFPCATPRMAAQRQLLPSDLAKAPMGLLQSIHAGIEAKLLTATALDALNKHITQFGWTSLVPHRFRPQMLIHSKHLVASEAVSVQMAVNDAIAKIHPD